MNHSCSIIAVPALAVAAVVLTSAEATAKVPPEDPKPAAVVPHDPGPPNYPSYQVPAQTSTNTKGSADDTTVEALQAGASAIGGAGIAIAGTWLYRRRQTHIA
jgi:hypothetical protein